MAGTSVVYWRFKAMREPLTVSFEGTGISVWDLKKEIIASQNMGKGADFDFEIYDADTNDEYRNDNQVISRATTVLARRAPPRRGPGRGTAQQYMVESGAVAEGGPRGANVGFGGRGGRFAGMSRRFDNHDDGGPPPEVTFTNADDVQLNNADDADAIKNMLAQQTEQWNQEQERMATGTRVGFSGAGRGRGGYHSAAPSRPPPPSYYCHRCGKPGHWIQDCPTNDDSTYDNRPRLKRTTGIPRSFLVAVEAPEGAEGQAGVMVTADGGFVMARPDSASWQQHRSAARNLTADDVEGLQPTDPDLTCPIDSKLLREAVRVPCCGQAFCDDCIRASLRDGDMVCPECESRVKSLDLLKPDEDRRQRVKAYVAEMVRDSQDDEAEGEGTEGGGGPSKAGTPAPDGSGDAVKPDADRSSSPKSAPAERTASAPSADSLAPAAAAADPTASMPPHVAAIYQQYMQVHQALSNPQLPMPQRQQYMIFAQQLQAQYQMAAANPQMAMAMAQQHQQQQQQPPHQYAGAPSQPQFQHPYGVGTGVGRGSTVRGRGRGISPFGPNSGAIRPAVKRDRPADFDTPSDRR